MIEFNGSDLPDSHERVGKEELEEWDTENSHTWHIYISGQHSIGRETHEITKGVFNEDIAMTIIPEEASINMLSFFFEGTYKEARVAGEVMCDKLNKFEGTKEAWTTSRDQTMLIEEEPVKSNNGP